MTLVAKFFSGLLAFLPKIGLARILTIALSATIIVSAGLTYVVITNPDLFGFASDIDLQSNMLLFNFSLLLLLAVLVSHKILRVWMETSRGKSGSRLLLRLIFMFSIIALVPAVVVGVSSSFYLNLGIKSWFDERVSKAVDKSLSVAEAYLEEHKKVIKADALNIATEINNNTIRFAFDTKRLDIYLTNQATKRLLAEVIVFQEDRVVASSALGLDIDPLEQVTMEQIEQASTGEVILIPELGDKITAISALANIPNTYLLVSRYIDANVVAETDEVRGAAEEYKKLKEQIDDFRDRSTEFFVIISMFLLLGALLMALRFANSIVQPVSNLVNATDKIKRGEFAVRVKEVGSEKDEITILSRSFNQMAAELESQKRGVIIANQAAEDKEQFSEAVLQGISSGVVAIDEDLKIQLMNPSAKEYLSLTDDDIGKYFKDQIPEFFEVFDKFVKRPTKAMREQVSVRRNSKRKSFILRINPHIEKDTEGYLLTFDDITELLSAQRSSAWSDVARRIAHEIKNPLTPINLSAQRLAKKFVKKIPEEDKENFEGYTNTITRHTADIARIIGEFSDFAKLPAPKFGKADISPLLKDSVFSARVAHSDIKFELDMPDQMETIADASQITQVLTNVIKNAAESVSEHRKKGGKITAKAEMQDNIVITIEDNGKGFPEELIDRITEPYVTTREKGTGLGLAIVKKIVSDHSGEIEISNKRVGARVKITLPVLS